MNRVLLVILLALVGCASSSNADPTEPTTAGSTATSLQPAMIADASVSGLFPDVVAAEVVRNGDGTYRFDVTISSPYDSNDQYADAWRVLGLEGTEYGVRILTHPHANEQPFTRSLDGIEIPDDVATVVVQGRDLVNGWGGATLEVNLNEMG